jgi:hypothetical protein
VPAEGDGDQVHRPQAHQVANDVPGVSGGSGGVLGLPENGFGGDIPHVLLTEYQRHVEAVLAAAVAIEFIRIAQPSDSRVTARYAASAVDNSRLLCAGSPRLHLSLLHGQLKWLRSLPAGCGELQW